jgi:glycerol uptake facilitator-like aquaporin
VRLRQRVLAEAIGTCLLVACVVGSGIAASRLSPADVGLQLLENSIATGAVLVALILSLHPVSAAFNPLVSLLELGFGSIGWDEAWALVLAQLAGGIVGAVLANLMFGMSAVSISGHARVSPGALLGEVVATFGLVVVVFGGLRTARVETLAVAVGAYIAAAYWFTSSTSFANPAVTVARMLSDSFAGIAPGSVPWFVLAQLSGALLGALAVNALFPRARVVAGG